MTFRQSPAINYYLKFVETSCRVNPDLQKNTSFAPLQGYIVYMTVPEKAHIIVNPPHFLMNPDYCNRPNRLSLCWVMDCVPNQDVVLLAGSFERISLLSE